MKYTITLTIGVILGIFSQHFLVSESPSAMEFESTKMERHEAAEWMARAIYSETKKMSNFEYIAWVIRNRMSSPEYPMSAGKVVLQEDQFSAFDEPEKRDKLMRMTYPKEKNTHFRRAYRVALYVLNADPNMNPLPRVQHFYMEDTMEEKYNKSQPYWAKGKEPFFSNGQTVYLQGVEGP